MRISIRLILCLGVLLGAGCQAGTIQVETPVDAGTSPAQAPLSTPLPGTQDPSIPTPDRIDPTMTKQLERVPSSEPVTPIVGEVPAALLDSILKDLAERTGANVENIVVYQAQAVEWSDGSLGCAQPGMFYTQATVSGYWVILKIGEEQYDYHTNDRGYFFLCEGIPRPNPPATPTS